MKTLATAMALAAATFALAVPPAASAQTVLSDKRSGGNYDSFDIADIFTKANACGCGPADSAALVDSFTLASRSRLTGVAADMIGYDLTFVPPAFKSFGDAGGYRVDIYSAATKAAESLVGDVYSRSFAPTAVTFSSVNGFTAPDLWDVTKVASTAQASFAVDLDLGAGTYWLAVTAVNDPDDNGTIAVGLSGTGNAMWANPGGGWGLAPDNYLQYGTNAAYAVFGSAVPEPGSWAMMICGFGIVGAGLRRRRVAAAAAAA